MANAVLGASFRSSLFNPVNGLFLTGGQIFFYGSDKTTLKNVYDSPTKETPYANPYTLNDSVASLPPFYYDTDDSYYIEVRNAPDPGCPEVPGSTVYTFDYYPSSGGLEGEEAHNFITNGVFSHPHNFNKPDDKAGEVTSDITSVCAAWTLEAPSSANKSVNVSFNNLEEANLDANPINEIVVLNGAPADTEEHINLVNELGYVNKLQGRQVTFAASVRSDSGSGETVELLMRQHYNNNEVIETLVGSFTVPSTREQRVLSFKVPQLESATLDLIHNRVEFLIRFPGAKIFEIAFTKVQLRIGEIQSPNFPEIPTSLQNAKVLGDIYHFPEDKFNDRLGAADYSVFRYVKGEIVSQLQTGQVFPRLASHVEPDEILCDGSSLVVNEYSENGIPYNRLYNIIGSQFGGAGSLDVVAKGAVITFTIDPGDKAKSAYTAGTTSFTVTEVTNGLSLGVKASKLSANEIKLTWTDNFIANTALFNYNQPYNGGTLNLLYSTSPVTGIIGCWNTYAFTRKEGTTVQFNYSNSTISAADIAPGSASTPPEAKITFNPVSNFSLYQTNSITAKTLTNSDPDDATAFINFLDLPSVTNNVHAQPLTVKSTSGSAPPSRTATGAPMQVFFSVDGKKGGAVNATEHSTTLDFKSSKSLEQNINDFIKVINNSFIWTVEVTAVPTASQYFLYSDATVDRYAWYFVTDGGGGTDPAIAGRTGVQVTILTTDSFEEIAQKTAATLNDLNFSLPTQADLPTLPNAAFKWYIKL